MNIKGCEKMESMKWIWQYVRKYSHVFYTLLTLLTIYLVLIFVVAVSSTQNVIIIVMLHPLA
ncbi:hypothetical protein FVE18_12175 [Listeria monocytogenes]|nr:hypothetical protein FVE18_12175 [Listeria monocytogenes]